MEEAVVKNIVRLLSDMGRDFLFAGRQYKVIIDDKEFFIDLLFYHRKLRCFVVVELNEHIGQIQGYMACVDNLVKYEDESPSISIIICKSKNRTMVEFALHNTSDPVGVATFKYNTLPDNISKYLPSEEDIIESIDSMEEETDLEIKRL